MVTEATTSVVPTIDEPSDAPRRGRAGRVLAVATFLIAGAVPAAVQIAGQDVDEAHVLAVAPSPPETFIDLVRSLSQGGASRVGVVESSTTTTIAPVEQVEPAVPGFPSSSIASSASTSTSLALRLPELTEEPFTGVTSNAVRPTRSDPSSSTTTTQPGPTTTSGAGSTTTSQPGSSTTTTQPGPSTTGPAPSTTTTRPLPPPPPPPSTTTTTLPPTTTTTARPTTGCRTRLTPDPIAVPSWGFAFDGQSNTLSPDPSTAYPAKLVALRFPGGAHITTARAGTDFLERTSWAPESLDPFAAARPYMVLFNEGGPTDLHRGATAAQLFERVRVYSAGRRAAGFDVIVGATVPPSADYYDGAGEAQRVAYNDLLRRQCAQAGIDVLVDVAAIPELRDPRDERYYLDGIHFTEAAATLVARAYAAALP